MTRPGVDEQRAAVHWLLIALLGFVAVIAWAHGGWLLTSAAGSVAHGLILLVGVGGSAALAMVLALLHHERAAQAALGAGLMLLLWIITQMVTLHEGMWLEIGDLLIADTIILLASSRAAKDRAYAHHAA